MTQSAPTLDVTRNSAERVLARQLGMDPTQTDTSATEKADFDIIFERGLRNFYYPPVLPGEAHAHQWSFLKPELLLMTVPNQQNYDMPDDFAAIEGALTYRRDDAAWLPIKDVGEFRIRQLRSSSVRSTGYPEWYAIVPRPSNGDEPQRSTMMLWPDPSGNWELAGRYRSNPALITGDKPYPMGGQPHAETLLASILAAAESFYDERRGLRYAEFMERLQASVSWDRRMTGPKHFGTNGSNDDRWPRRRASTVTYTRRES